MNTIANEKPADAILVIDAAAKRYSDERKVLAGYATDYKLALEQLNARHMPLIRDAATRCTTVEAQLHQLIAARPDLFVKPRTMTLHGIKLGFIKGKGRLVIENAAKLLDRIRAQFGKAKAATLLKVKTTPDKTALGKLTAPELKKLGISIVGTGDAVFIETADTHVDKFLATILAEGSKPATEEEAA